MADPDDFPSEHLDLARGLAALAVAAWHWRSFFFRNYDATRSQGPLEQAFYFLTGFGHSAVMVFFVLSGYFIARSIFRDLALDRWSWRNYAVARGTRLYLVLVPALALGFAWDFTGSKLFGPASLYGGDVSRFGALVVWWRVEDTLTWWNVLGNLAFMQYIRASIFGSNGALWSLAYEGWYYVLFPLGLFALRPRTGPFTRLACLAGIAAAVPLLGGRVLGMGLIWLAGAIVAALPVRRVPAWVPALASLALVAALVVVRAGYVGEIAGERLVAAAVAAWIYAVVAGCRAWPGGWYARLAGGLAGCSYSLYLVHMPFLLFCAAWAVGGARWEPDAGHVALAFPALVAGVGYGWLVAQGTEAHTGRVRAWVGRYVGARPRGGKMEG